MPQITEPVFEDLGSGRGRLTFVGDMAAGAHLCEITWYHRPDGIRVLDHTFVPPTLTGHGLAAILTEAALNRARKDQVRILPHCSYVARWIDRHPEWQEWVAT
ncbi:GNAT family N-acetyltransferase [Aquidulcibacter paucihalophilus]|uniref:GNAT family N-acetyltransferase n=1 Tax=Aquidulcibacter paucihalophilus TaxID=1978549 RepID=UPI000A190571|nr:GNAT family N-acetyltransferase [Aquidulcibacter paucihalophilus]